MLPGSLQELLGQSQDRGRNGRLIEAVEVVKVTGTREVLQGVNRQGNLQPLYIYKEHKPEQFVDPENPKMGNQTLTHNYVRIRTRNGLEGFYGSVDSEAVDTIIGQLGRFLIGKDAMAVEQLWDQMYRLNRHGRAGHFMMAISYLDNCLWDWRGRYFGAPVYELLGGPTRNPIKVYGSCLGFSIQPEAMARKSAELKAAGFDYQKWFIFNGPSEGPEGLRKAIDMVRILRESVGPEAELMFDAFNGWTLQFAKQWAEAVEQYRPGWIEEAFMTADLESFIRLSKATNIPVATGEHFYNRWDVQKFLQADAIQIVQADPEWCGGVSELLKICHVASVFGAQVVPHCHNVHAALHVGASQSPALVPFGEYLIVHVPNKVYFQKDPPVTDNGWVTLSDRPGFGIELDEAKIEKTEIMSAT